MYDNVIDKNKNQLDEYYEHYYDNTVSNIKIKQQIQLVDFQNPAIIGMHLCKCGQQSYIHNDIINLKKSIITIDHLQISQLLQKHLKVKQYKHQTYDYGKFSQIYCKIASDGGGVIIIGLKPDNVVESDNSPKLQKYYDQKEHISYNFQKSYKLEGIPLVKQNNDKYGNSQLQFIKSEGNSQKQQLNFAQNYYCGQNFFKQNLQIILSKCRQSCFIKQNQVQNIIKFIPVYKNQDDKNKGEAPVSFIIEIRLRFSSELRYRQFFIRQGIVGNQFDAKLKSVSGKFTFLNKEIDNFSHEEVLDLDVSEIYDKIHEKYYQSLVKANKNLTTNHRNNPYELFICDNQNKYPIKCPKKTHKNSQKHYQNSIKNSQIEQKKTEIIEIKSNNSEQNIPIVLPNNIYQSVIIASDNEIADKNQNLLIKQLQAAQMTYKFYDQYSKYMPSSKRKIILFEHSKRFKYIKQIYTGKLDDSSKRFLIMEVQQEMILLTKMDQSQGFRIQNVFKILKELTYTYQTTYQYGKINKSAVNLKHNTYLFSFAFKGHALFAFILLENNKIKCRFVNSAKKGQAELLQRMQ